MVLCVMGWPAAALRLSIDGRYQEPLRRRWQLARAYEKSDCEDCIGLLSGLWLTLDVYVSVLCF